MPSSGGNPDRAERVALLLRVSSEEQRERETIEIQREFLQEYCRLYGLEVAQIYADDGVSGTIPLHEGRKAGGSSRMLKRASSPRSSSTAWIGSAGPSWSLSTPTIGYRPAVWPSRVLPSR
jgi:Resolvase, N terminal domain